MTDRAGPASSLHRVEFNAFHTHGDSADPLLVRPSAKWNERASHRNCIKCTVLPRASCRVMCDRGMTRNRLETTYSKILVVSRINADK